MSPTVKGPSPGPRPPGSWPPRTAYPASDMAEHFLPIDAHRPRLADEVYRQLVDALSDGGLRPGDRLIQERIAEAMGVSRTPVREALLRLEQERIIVPGNRGGFIVRAASENEIREIYETREAIEGYAARLLAERGDETALSLIDKAIDEHSTQAHDTAHEGYLANKAVHRAIVRATGNTQLVGLFDAVWDRSVAVLLYADLHRITEAAFEPSHEELLDTFRAGDPDRACTAMIEHIRVGLAEQLSIHDPSKARYETP